MYKRSTSPNFRVYGPVSFGLDHSDHVSLSPCCIYVDPQSASDNSTSTSTTGTLPLLPATTSSCLLPSLVASMQKSASTTPQAAATSSPPKSLNGSDQPAQEGLKLSTQTDDFLFELLETIEAEDRTQASPLASPRISDVVSDDSLTKMSSTFDDRYDSRASVGGFASFIYSVPLPDYSDSDSDELASLRDFDSSDDDAADMSDDESIDDEERELREIQKLLDSGDH